MLRGEARREEVGGEEFLRHFPAAALPTDPAARFAALFAARPRWELPDLEPYLADLQVCISGNYKSLQGFTRPDQSLSGSWSLLPLCMVAARYTWWLHVHQ